MQEVHPIIVIIKNVENMNAGIKSADFKANFFIFFFELKILIIITVKLQ
jgi:hypothetical protein